jgi:hypothetical protein
MRFSMTVVTILLIAACSQMSPVRPDPISGSSAEGVSQNLVLPAADQGGRPLTTPMSGAEEVPGPGDADGSGTATITLNHGQGELCFSLTVADIDPATAAHVHKAPAGVAGGIVVGLTPPTSGSSSGCVPVDPDLIKDITQNPSEYYVNVHNSTFPAGAIRGQLAK